MTGIDLRLPDISGSDREQLVKIRSYLYQLIPQLQFALNNVSTSTSQQVATPTVNSVSHSYTLSDSSAESTFNSIKSLIIKSAEIVEAYYDEINRRLEGVYVAQSDFGDYVEKTSQEIEETSTSTTQRFENIQVIINNLDGNIGLITGNLESIEGSLETIGQDLSYAQSSIVNINSNIETLDGYVASVEGEVNALDTTLKTTKNEILDDLYNTKEELSCDMYNAKSELTGMVEEVDEDLQTTKTDVNGRIDDTNGSVASLGSGLNDANTKIAEVDGDLQDAKEIINNNIQGVQDSVLGVNALLEDAKRQLQGSLDDLEVGINRLNENISVTPEAVVIGVTATIKSGQLYSTDAGIPVYGIEIGQTVDVNGNEEFKKFARFTSEKLSFYDSNGYEVAYFSDKKLFIKMAEITVSFQIGKIIDLVMDNGDVVTKWVGG